MLKLMLLRHAKAVHSSQYEDIDRPLTARGHADTKLIGADIAEHRYNPDIALVSTACRTRETWDGVKDYIGSVLPRFEEQLYHASAQEMVKCLHEIKEKAATVLLVGHNPGIAYLANTLAGSGENARRAELRTKFPTCALAVISFDVASWTDIRPSAGTLEYFVYPKLLGGSDG